MKNLRLRLRLRTDPERGSVTVFFAISVLGLLLLIGLVADGGAKLRATQQAAATAAEAARATGTVAVSDDRTRLTVTVTRTAPTAFLSLIGIDTLTVTAHADAVLVGGITGGGT